MCHFFSRISIDVLCTGICRAEACQLFPLHGDLRGKMAAAQDNLTAEHWAEIERLQGDAFEPALGEPFVAIPFAWWSAFRDRCMGDQEIFVAKEIDCKEMLSEASSLALKRGLVRAQTGGSIFLDSSERAVGALARSVPIACTLCVRVSCCSP